jgi:nitrogenase-associated protein
VTAIVFYEKPGCIGNARQKQLLVGLGHRLEVRDLLRTAWDADDLASYFDGMRVRDWLNPSAPAVRDGEIDIDALDADAALALLLAQPLLIRRPLIDSPHGRCAGFVPGPVLAALGVPDAARELDTCARGTQTPQSGAQSCDARAAACRSDTGRRATDAPAPAHSGAGRSSIVQGSTGRSPGQHSRAAPAGSAGP